MFKLIEKIPRPLLMGINLVIILIVGFADYLTGTELSFSIFYFLPLMITNWYINLKTGLFFSFISAATWFTADLLGKHIYSSNYIFAWNTLMRLGIFIIISIVIYNLKKNYEIAKKKELMTQKSFYIINTSQQLTGIIAENISKHNSALLFWVERQKANGKIVSNIIESTCHNISTNLHALTEICFGNTTSEKNIDLENFIDSLQNKIMQINNNLDNEAKKTKDLNKINEIYKQIENHEYESEEKTELIK